MLSFAAHTIEGALMSKTGQTPGLDAAYLEALHAQWKDDPTSVDTSWQYFFQGLDRKSVV